MFKWLFCRIVGHRLGEIKIVKALPFIIGDVWHFMPTECWGDREKKSLRFALDWFEWMGYEWQHMGTIEISRGALRGYLE